MFHWRRRARRERRKAGRAKKWEMSWRKPDEYEKVYKRMAEKAVKKVLFMKKCNYAKATNVLGCESKRASCSALVNLCVMGNFDDEFTKNLKLLKVT